MFNFLNKLFKPEYTLSEIHIKPDNLLSIKRSPKWWELRKEFIEENGGKCAACGFSTNLEVHHIIPLHIRPDLELDKNNLIVLCENKSLFCHFVLGHSFNWRAYNPMVIDDAARLKFRKETRLFKTD